MALRQCIGCGWSLPDSLQGLIDVCVALEDAQDELTRLREELATLKRNPWADMPEYCLRDVAEQIELYGAEGCTVYPQIMAELKRREVGDE
jgi:hypothetical protein